MGFITTGFHEEQVEVVEFPDTELMLVTYLGSLLDEDARVTAKLGEDDFPFTTPIVRVTLIDATETLAKVLQRSVVDVDIWHTDLVSLNALVLRVRSLLQAIEGAIIGDGGVTQSLSFGYAGRIDEDDTTILRAGFSVALLVRPMNY